MARNEPGASPDEDYRALEQQIRRMEGVERWKGSGRGRVVLLTILIVVGLAVVIAILLIADHYGFDYSGPDV